VKNKNYQILSFVVLILIGISCTKSANELPIATESSFKVYRIPRGEHYCNESTFSNLSVSEVQFTVQFDSSAIYTTTDPLNQYDINKLWGFTEGTDNHLNSAKHLKEINSSIFKQKLSNTFECDNCAKIFQTNSGLWKHKSKGCAINNENKDYDKSSDTLISKELITMLIKDNSELKHMMMEVIKNVGHNTTNTNINSHNKSFNLNFFLNETCKNAMNITDFVDSLKLQLSDLERVGELGYIEGISSIIINNLKELDVTLRPVHCTDKKRETIYIKDENKWEKDEENKKMHKLVRKVADKNARLLPKFKEKYPDYKKSSSKVSDQFNKILIESMGGAGDNDFEKEEKIIKRVSKEVTVEKS
jgi:hypothetical protein